jgi:predicted MPP superfamily phosphohydrolase
MGLFSSLFVLTVLRDALLLIVAIVDVAVPAALPFGATLTWSAALVPALAAMATLWGYVNARRTAAVVSVDVPIAGLPAGLHGFRIAQISDIHVGPTIKRPYLQAIVQAVNRLDADMVAVTGDLVDGSVQDLGVHVAPLAALASRHGTYFVTDNHEYYAGAHAWIAELRRLGVQVLLNEHVVLRHGGAALVVAGVTDFGAHHYDPTHRSDPRAALAGAPADAGARVLLAHQPRSAEAAERAGFQLQLSGHTHGGQFLPWNWFVPLQQPFTAGLHKLRALWVYTSRGTGYWGPPKRLGAASEITELRLVAAPA